MTFIYSQRLPKNKNLEEVFSFSGKIVNASRVVSTKRFTKPTVAFTTLPSTSCYRSAWSPSGLYISYTNFAVTNVGTTSSLSTFFYNGETAIKLSPPSVLPGAWPAKGYNSGANSYGVSWSPDGTKLAVGSSGSHKLNVYKMVGTQTQTFQNITQADLPFTFPTAAEAIHISWSPDSSYVCVSLNLSPYLYIFSVSDTAVSPYYNLGTRHPFASRSSDWSPDGRYLAVTYDRPPYLGLFEFDGENFNELSIPANVPHYSRHVKWSPDGKNLLICHLQKPGVSLWAFEDGLLSSLGVFPQRPVVSGQNDRCYWADWAPDGTHFITSWQYSPTFSMYSFDGKAAEREPFPPNFSPTTVLTPVCSYRPGGDAFVIGEYVASGSGDSFGTSNLLSLSRVNNTPT